MPYNYVLFLAILGWGVALLLLGIFMGVSSDNKIVKIKDDSEEKSDE